MSGLFSTVQNASRSLFASQLAMDVAGQNISNADVTGYSRKRLNMTAEYRYDGSYGQMGFGVDVVNIERMRDAQLDQQIRRQNQEVGYYDSIDQTLTQVENILMEPSNTGVQSYVDNFFDAWQNLANNPSDLSARTMVKTSGEILTDVFHNAAGELKNLKTGVNDKVGTDMDRVNELSKELYNMNLEIGSVEIGNQNANDSRDKRDRLLKELSKLVDIDTVENDQGQMTITTSGNILVSPTNYRLLEKTTTTFNLPDGTQEANIGIRFADSKSVLSPLSGEIKGLFACRDQIIPEYQKKLDTLATTIAQKVNEKHERGYNMYGFTGTEFFDSQITGASDITLAAPILLDVQNIAAASGGEANPATANTFGAGALNFGTAPMLLSKSNSLPPVGADIARNVINGSAVVQVTLGGITTMLKENVDFHIDYVNGTIQMLHAGYNGATTNVQFDYRSGASQGPGDNSNAVAIAQLRQTMTMEPDPLGNPTNTFAQFYSSFIGRLGLNKNETSSNLETRNFLISQYETHQDSIAGVSMDEEIADIIKFQHTYQASARVISAADKMLDILMNI